MKIFFDLDGPLLDVSERYYQVYRDFRVQYNINYASKNVFWKKKRSKQPIYIPKEFTDKYKKFWINNIETTKYIKFDKLFKYSAKILGDLCKYYPLYLVTLRHNQKLLYRQISNLKIRQYFKKIMVTSPAIFNTPRNYQIKMKMIKKISKKNDIIIGDTGTDIRCGNKLNLTTIAVLSGISNYKILRSHSPDYIIKSVNSIKNIKKIDGLT